ncbi:hypothetical protein XELAEV_18022988mg [Xenopus laevis]|uniref:Uncharacterized protein n=1 Tax=Xenopus laevis TaxID=8355 RepID=A0A974D5S6_XENLA|nr:hypothetical protein XELAEV_18022988mg [Xenopus laevis]
MQFCYSNVPLTNSCFFFLFLMLIVGANPNAIIPSSLAPFTQLQQGSMLYNCFNIQHNLYLVSISSC